MYPFFNVKSAGSTVAAVSNHHQHFVRLICGFVLTSHVSELFASGFEIVAVLGLHCILDSTGHSVVCAEDCTLHQLQFSGSITLQTASLGGRSTRLYSSLPVDCRRSLLSVVWRSSSWRLTVARCICVIAGSVALCIVQIVARAVCVVRICLRQAIR